MCFFVLKGNETEHRHLWVLKGNHMGVGVCGGRLSLELRCSFWFPFRTKMELVFPLGFPLLTQLIHSGGFLFGFPLKSNQPGLLCQTQQTKPIQLVLAPAGRPSLRTDLFTSPPLKGSNKKKSSTTSKTVQHVSQQQPHTHTPLPPAPRSPRAASSSPRLSAGSCATAWRRCAEWPAPLPRRPPPAGFEGFEARLKTRSSRWQGCSGGC